MKEAPRLVEADVGVGVTGGGRGEGEQTKKTVVVSISSIPGKRNPRRPSPSPVSSRKRAPS